MKPYLAFAGALLLAIPGLTLAQAQTDPQMEEQMQQQEPETTTYQDWEVACIETQGGERCRMQQTLQIQDEQAQGAYLQASVFRDGDSYIIEILLPLGVDLRPGILMQVDDDGEEIEAPYIACVEQGCVAGHELSESQFNAMRGGSALTVGFWPLHGDQPLAFDVSLMGFTDASERL
ncbi:MULTISPECIES: invasion associated locus B family protein [unclassified Thioalkalivibrio]|uniref:invasion associated locus B family protein n=1 Tax=unclassified Thioalkalivibrio TaxID=2621013 RepID=UPI00037B67BB|nr:MULTISPECIES: invasion associated locus B family protein [unclassified Thioalkalivibrio]